MGGKVRVRVGKRVWSIIGGKVRVRECKG